MSKWKVLQIIVLSVACAWIFDVFVGRTLVAKISTLPVLNRWHILAPQAPIVINNRETVRVSDSGDLLDAANLAKSKLSTVVSVAGNKITIAGNAVNLTSDGLFATGVSTFSPNGNYIVVLNDGTNSLITQTSPDPATGLVFFKAALNNVPVAPLGDSTQLTPGEKILFLNNSLQNFNDKFYGSFVTMAQADVAGQIFSSDHYSRSFGAQSVGALLPGQAVVNLKGEIVGIWNGSSLISSDVLRQEMDSYFSNNRQFIRPSFNFSYQILTKAESQLLNLPEGARVTEIAAGNSKNSPTSLAVGDIITAVNDAKINQDNPLEAELQKYKPNDQIKFTVIRGAQTLSLTLIAGLQK